MAVTTVIHMVCDIAERGSLPIIDSSLFLQLMLIFYIVIRFRLFTGLAVSDCPTEHCRYYIQNGSVLVCILLLSHPGLDHFPVENQKFIEIVGLVG